MIGHPPQHGEGDRSQSGGGVSAPEERMTLATGGITPPPPASPAVPLPVPGRM